jgi:prepilin-type N-terminal cleavage/methylation domain-containing protein
MKKGFTLLEIIIVIIIVGVLAALSLPRLVSMIEGARAAEAQAAIMSIRSVLERTYLMGVSSKIIAVSTNNTSWDAIGMEDPADAPNAHFNYSASIDPAGTMLVLALRNCRDGGVPSIGATGYNLIYYGKNEVQRKSDLCGIGIYKGIRQGSGHCGNWLSWWLVYGDMVDWAGLTGIKETCP